MAIMTKFFLSFVLISSLLSAQNKKHILLYAKRVIKLGEEITYDYNFECEAEKISCRCGSKNCLGRLN